MRMIAALLIAASVGSLRPATLPQGTSLLPAQGLSAFQSGDNPRGKASLDKQGGQDLLHLDVTDEHIANPWDLQAQAKIAAPVEAGDRILASFKMRCLKSRAESGEAASEFDFELAKEPWTKSVSYPLRAGKDWVQYDIPFEAAGSYEAGGAQLIFRMGYAPETFEISDLKVTHYGKSVALEALPRTHLSYAGHEADAPWRKSAAERIQKYRTAAIKITVLDATGAPLQGARIEVSEIKSAFGFGSALSGHYVFKDSDAAGRAKYEEMARREFNMATVENALKWQPLAGDWGGDWGLDLAVNSANWVKAQGLDLRAHNLVWPSWRNMPKAAEALKADPKALHALLFDHIKETAGAMKGLPLQWDVINEPFDNHDLMDIFGQGVMLDIFKAARAEDRSALLYINDYGILPGGAGDTPHRKRYEEVIQYLTDHQAPLDGIGLQGHFGMSLSSPDELLALLNRYARFGKKLMITEYDTDLDDEALAADYLRDVLTVCYSHPAVAGFVMWGFWDGAHWKGHAPLFRKDWSPKPAAKAWESLVLNDWRTLESGQSGGDGIYETRGYLGQDEVKVSRGEKKKTVKALLGLDGMELKVVLN